MRYALFSILIILASCNRGEVDDYEVYLSHNDTVRYVGKEQCRMCHADIYDSYMHTGMGNSLHYATREHSALDGTNMPIINDTVRNLSYQPFFKNDSLFIREFRLLGKDTVHQLVKKVDYKIGSGQHTNSHLFMINGYMHQIPYTYYTQEEIADLPPGFEGKNNSRFSREIALECMSCHNAKTNHENASSNRYNDMPQGIDCERCHGPGEVHVKRKLAGEIIDTSSYIDYSIVNPARLPLDLQFDICQRCHLQGTSILATGKSFESFKPGMHLEDVMDTYLPRYENDHSFIMASHVDRLQQSSCFENSDMTCVSCHNPHKSVTTLGSNYFDSKCMQCHDICDDKQTQNCTSCHMPSSSSSDIMHVTITDHKIGVHSDSQSEKGKFLGLFAINNPKPSKLSKAKAYLKRYESFENESVYLDSALYYLARSEDNFTSYIQYFYLRADNIGMINFIMSNKIDEVRYKESDLALTYSRMGEVFSQNNFPVEAEKYHKKAIELMSFVIDYKNKYGSFLFNNNRIDEAKEQYLDALKLNPTIKEIHANLGVIAISEGNYEHAESNLKQAIALDPDYLLAYENLVVLSQKIKDFNATKLYLHKILEIDPKHKAKQILESL